MALSPNGKTLLVLTSGYNRNYGTDGKMIPDLSNEYVFIYDVSGPLPVKRQVVQVPNTFLGIVWHPDGQRFFVSGGVDDVVYEYKHTDGAYARSGSITLSHDKGVGVEGTKPEAAGLAVSPDGRFILVANYQNDSVSLLDTTAGKVVDETDLRPGILDPSRSGTPGGTYPNVVAFTSNAKAYVASQRDRELIALGIDNGKLSVVARKPVDGQPAAIAISPHKSRAYVALDNTDRIAVFDTRTDEQIEQIAAAAPRALWRNPQGLHGANTNGLALSADGRLLWASNGGLNAVALIQLGSVSLDPEIAMAVRTEAMEDPRDGKDDDDEDDDEGFGWPAASQVIGLLPTGWYPTSVAIRPDNGRIFVANGKSNTGPNPLGCRNTLDSSRHAKDPCRSANQYDWQLEKAGLLSMPMPSPGQIVDMSWQVAFNNNFPSVAAHGHNAEIMNFLRSRIHHVIYVVKENRSYDQILGDLEVGNGDPDLTLLPEPVSPNHHALARDFVTLDNFFCSGESSNTGWSWTTAGRTTDSNERTAPVNYARRGLQRDTDGNNRGINVGMASLEERKTSNPAIPDDPDIMAGTADVAAPDAPYAADARMTGTGYLWDAALRAGLTFRNYGFYPDRSRYSTKNPGYLPATLHEPFKNGIQVIFPARASLVPYTDIYFRGYDQKYPDYWRYKEWEREFDAYAEKGELPDLMLVALQHDHFGSFGDAIDGVNTVETQMADNDLALGLLVEKVAKSPFADSTLIFVVEDDAQDGADHVDAHRSPAFVIGPYVRHHAVISERYTTVNVLRTIEDVLGLPTLGLNDGMADPMGAVFDLDQTSWTFEPHVPEVLRTTDLPLPPESPESPESDATNATNCQARPARSAAYWQEAMKGQDFSEEDRLDTVRFNKALWQGLKGNTPLPTDHRGEDLSRNRAERLAEFRKTNGCTQKTHE